MNEEKLTFIGINAGLTDFRLKLFVYFMQNRLPNEGDEGYTTEWAKRFYNGTEWCYADNESWQTLINFHNQYNGSQKLKLVKK